MGGGFNTAIGLHWRQQDCLMAGTVEVIRRAICNSLQRQQSFAATGWVSRDISTVFLPVGRYWLAVIRGYRSASWCTRYRAALWWQFPVRPDVGVFQLFPPRWMHLWRKCGLLLLVMLVASRRSVDYLPWPGITRRLHWLQRTARLWRRCDCGSARRPLLSWSHGGLWERYPPVRKYSALRSSRRGWKVEKAATGVLNGHRPSPRRVRRRRWGHGCRGTR